MLTDIPKETLSERPLDIELERPSDIELERRSETLQAIFFEPKGRDDISVWCETQANCNQKRKIDSLDTR